MNEHLVAEFVNSVDNIISQPIHLTQRIKYTCYDVSVKYIIFGASSGGLYIFNRYPCSFIKLIPSAEGSAVHICISPDEKNIAVATGKGTLCVVNNDDTISKDIHVYNEHQGNIVTAMIWNDNSNELYSGDNTGKISVVVVTNFIAKTIFQIPCTTLMQVDSRIVQLDWSCNFLLVSTLSRCYLCDTEREQYRQIGKKLRDGEFGACFFGANGEIPASSERRPEMGNFRILSDKESFTFDGLENLKMFCSRPGSRLWEVNLNGTVIRTHQFKEALAIGPNNIIPLSQDLDCRLSLINKKSEKKETHSINFVKLQILNKQFIITYQKDGLYIFDPSNSTVLFWTNFYTNILEVKVVKNFIYLWTSRNQMHVLLFSSFEDFVVNCLLNKNYFLCADLCISHQKHIKKLLPTSKKLHLLSALSDKLTEKGATELNEKFQPVLNMIKEFTNDRQTAQKLTSGIFVIDNAHFVNNLSESGHKIALGTDFEVNKPDLEVNNRDLEVNKPDLEINKPGLEINKPDFEVNKPESSQSSNHGNKEETFNADAKMPKIVSNREILDTSNIFSNNTVKESLNNDNRVLYEEYELNKINKLYKTQVVERILGKINSFEDKIDVLNKFEEYAIKLHPEENIRIWCYEKFLEHIKKHDLKTMPHTLEKYLSDAFRAINLSSEDSCECGFPSPTAVKKVPKFFDTGCKIIDKFWKIQKNSCLNVCHEVPYMWKYMLKIRQNENIQLLLPLIIQYSDIETWNIFSNKITYDLWNEVLEKFIVLKKGKCLNCEKVFQNGKNSEFSWNSLSREMIKSIGGENSVRLLLQYSQFIPPNELTADFYQSTIFSTIIENFKPKLRDNAINFMSNLNTDNNKEHFEKLLEKALQNPQAISNLNTSRNVSEKHCFSCDMPLQTPILSKEKLICLDCGHTFHNICLKTQNNACNICK